MTVVHTTSTTDMENVPLADIVFNKQLQLRHNTEAKDETIEKYIYWLKGDEKANIAPSDPPAIELFSVTEIGEHGPAGLYLVDGWLRCTSLQEVGRDVVPKARIVGEGSFEDALLYTCRVNVRHGLSRSPAETKDAVKRARQILGSKATLRDIAKHCGNISHVHVSRILKKEAEGENPPPKPGPKPSNGQVPAEIDLEETGKIVDAKGKEVPEEHKTLRDAFDARRHLRMAEQARNLMLKELHEAMRLIRDKRDKAVIKEVCDVDLKSVFETLATITPATICTKCKGESCEACNGRGYKTEA
jgi:hypothetical protein